MSLLEEKFYTGLQAPNDFQIPAPAPVQNEKMSDRIKECCAMKSCREAKENILENELNLPILQSVQHALLHTSSSVRYALLIVSPWPLTSHYRPSYCLAGM